MRPLLLGLFACIAAVPVSAFYPYENPGTGYGNPSGNGGSGWTNPQGNGSQTEWNGNGGPGEDDGTNGPRDNAAPRADYPAQYRQRAAEYYEQGRPREALSAVREGLKYAPEDESLLGLEKMYVRKINAAAIEGSRRNVESFLKGLAPAGAEDLGDARPRPQPEPRRAERAPQPPPALEAVQASIGPLPAALPPAPSGPSRGASPDFSRQGLASLQFGDPATAERRFSAAIAQDPRSAASFRMRALARRRLGRAEDALADADSAIALDPRDGWARKVRSLALLDLARPAEARLAADAALALDPRDADAYHARSLAWGKLGRAAERLSDLRRAAELDSAFQDAYRAALGEKEASLSESPPPRRSWRLYYLVVVPAGLLLIGAALLRRRGTTSAAFRAPTPAPGGAGLAPPAATPMGYELVRELGRGGMGEVFEAVDRGLERRVAIKRMLPEIAANQAERRRFLREARTVAALEHPHIVQIYSVLEEGAELYLVFELVRGETLRQTLNRRSALAAPEALELVGQIASALDYAHAQGVVHRDLKPANVMISASGAKVMDFGVSRREAETVSPATRGQVCGTPAYMAPEQLRGVAHPASDIYALGICLREMLLGRSDPKPGSRLADVLACATAADHERRFPTAAALVAALRTAV